MFTNIGFMLLKRPAWAHGFNEKIGFEKYASDPEIFVNLHQNLKVWFGKSNFDTGVFGFFGLPILSVLGWQSEADCGFGVESIVG